MGRRNRRGVMSENFKNELAKDLGFYDTIQRDGWGAIRTKDAGNMVKRAIQIAEQASKQQSMHQPQFGLKSAPSQSIPAQNVQIPPYAQQPYTQGESGPSPFRPY